tara:strand:- start:1217 stop:1942 length:726 start_codon:yes stop_codon:yes gene_type:complete
MTDSLSRPISISISIHVGLLAVMFLKMSFFPAEPIQIRRAMRVDIVGLPDKVQPKVLPPKEIPKAETPPKVKTETKPKPAAKPKPKAKPSPKVNLKKSQDSALQKMKAQEALAKIMEEKALEEVEETAEPTPIKGNAVSEGNSLTGLDQIEYDRYIDEVTTIISQWSLPEWLSSLDLKASAQVLIDENGYVTDKKIVNSSGNEMFDAEVLSAIEKSSPFPAPPARLKGRLASQGLIFNFPE